MVEAWLATLSSEGELVGETRISDPMGLVAYAAVSGPEGLLIAGGAEGMGWVAELDAELEIVWEDRFELEQGTRVYDLARFDDGRIALVGSTTLDPVEPDELAPTQGFVRIYAADRTVAGQRLVPEEVGWGSWELRAAEVLDGELLVAGQLLPGGSSSAHLWRFDAEAQLLAEAQPFDVFTSGILDLAASEGLGLFASGHASQGLPATNAVWRFSAIEDAPVWTFEGPPGMFESISLAESAPSIYVSGTNPANNESLATICRISQ